MSVAKDIGCNNEVCKDHDKCQRAIIYHDGTAREIKKFGGTPDKGCGKFIPIEDKK